MKKHKNLFTMKIFDEFSTPIDKKKGSIKELQLSLKNIKKKFS
jgi:hypothetical protein